MHDTHDDKIYIGGLLENVQRKDLEREFQRFGKIREVWVAQNPPGFGFVHFESRQDAAKAIRVMDGKMVCGANIRVEAAKARGPGGRSRQNSNRGPDRSQSRRQNDGRRQSSSGGRNSRDRNAGGRKRPRQETPPLERRLLAALPPLPSLRRSDVVETLDRLSTSLGLTGRRSLSPPATLRRRLDPPSSSLRSWSPPLPPLHLSSSRQLSPLRLGSRHLSPPRSLGARPLSPLRLGSRRLSPLRSLDPHRRSPLRSSTSLRRLSPMRGLDVSRRLSPPSNRAPSPLRLLPRDLLLEEEIAKHLGRDSLRRDSNLRLGDLGGRDSLSAPWERRLPSPPPPPSFLPSIPRYRSRSPVGRRRSPLSLLPPLAPPPRLRDTEYPARDYRSGCDYQSDDILGILSRRDQHDGERNKRQDRITSSQDRQGKARDSSWEVNRPQQRDGNRNRERNNSPGKGGRKPIQQQGQGKRLGGRRRDNKKGGRNKKLPLNMQQPQNKGRIRKQSGGRKPGKKGRGRAAVARKSKK